MSFHLSILKKSAKTVANSNFIELSFPWIHTSFFHTDNILYAEFQFSSLCRIVLSSTAGLPSAFCWVASWTFSEETRVGVRKHILLMQCDGRAQKSPFCALFSRHPLPTSHCLVNLSLIPCTFAPIYMNSKKANTLSPGERVGGGQDALSGV